MVRLLEKLACKLGLHYYEEIEGNPIGLHIREQRLKCSYCKKEIDDLAIEININKKKAGP